MLFYLFLTFQIFYSISCNLSCYEAPDDINTFDYFVTPDHFPTELDESSLKANSNECSITVTWRQNPDDTSIELIANKVINTEAAQHQLEVSVEYVLKESSSPTWTQYINYRCKTNRCNSLSQLKLLLQALMVNDSLAELTELLVPIGHFSGDWCHRAPNTTSDKCDTTIPTSSCTQCEAIGVKNSAGTELCTKCSTGKPYQSILKYGKTFNMIDRTNSINWHIVCERKSCNTPLVSENILEKGRIDFNFYKFLNAGPVSKANSFCMFFFNPIVIFLFLRSIRIFSESI